MKRSTPAQTRAAFEAWTLRHLVASINRCTYCRRILDARSTVVFRVFATLSGKEDLGTQIVACSRCWIALGARAKRKAKSQSVKHPSARIRTQILDGRTLCTLPPLTKGNQ